MSSDLEVFLDWARTRGILFDGLELRSAGEGLGNGVFATRFFRAEEKLITLPEGQMISAGSVAELPKYAAILEKSSSLLPPFDILTLFFCCEDVADSEWAPYLRMLPKEFETPSYRGSSIDPQDLPISIRKYWVDQTEELEQIYQRLCPLVPSLDRSKFIWAWHVVNTRCIYVENPPHCLVDNSQGDTLAVIPFVDMLNHEPDAQCLALHDRYSHNYIVKANGYIREGHQVFVCYGPHDNARLWMEYGFTMQANPNTKVVIARDLLVALGRKVGLPLTEQHESALVEANLPSNLYVTDDGPSWALRTNIRILLMDKQQILGWRDIIYAERQKRQQQNNESTDEDDDSTEAPLSEETRQENRTLRSILEQLKSSLVAKSNKAAKDLVWMWSEQLQLIDTVLESVE